jgi:hypothetical protein
LQAAIARICVCALVKQSRLKERRQLPLIHATDMATRHLVGLAKACCGTPLSSYAQNQLSLWPNSCDNARGLGVPFDEEPH